MEIFQPKMFHYFKESQTQNMLHGIYYEQGVYIFIFPVVHFIMGTKLTFNLKNPALTLRRQTAAL